MRTAVAVVAVFTLLDAALPGAARAQTPTDAKAVARDKPQEGAAALPTEIKPDFVQEAQGTFGALLNGGNVQGAAAKLGAFYGARVLQHGFRGDVGFGLNALAVDEDAEPKNGFTRVEEDGSLAPANAFDNLNTSGFAKLRYDFFFGDVGSVYAAGLGFHDSAANLLLRLRADVGYRHYLFNVPKHALSAEIGAVYTIDNAIFTVDDADTNGDGRVSVWGDETDFEEGGGVVGGRLALAYSNALLDNVTFTQLLEVVPNISLGADVPVFGYVDAPFETARSDDGRGDNQLGLGEATIASSATQLTMTLMDNLALAINATLIYDNAAIFRRNAYTNHDVATSIQLAYKFF